MIEHIIDRMKSVDELEGIIIATTMDEKMINSSMLMT